jgi:hypothetical protein
MPGKGPHVDPPVPGRHGGTFASFGDYSVNLFNQMGQTWRSLFDMAAVAIVKNASWAQKRVVGAPRLNGNSWEARDNNPRKVIFWENFNRDAIIADFFATMEKPATAGLYAAFELSQNKLTIDVDASGSRSSESQIVSYTWDFGDGTFETGIKAGHTYADYGNYTIALKLKDARGRTARASRSIHLHDGTADNPPDSNVNLALLPEAVLSGSGGGRGAPNHILYDPSKNDYTVKADWNEYGVAFNQNLGKTGENDPFFWQVEWPAPKNINYVTFGGQYPNQPQPHARWKIQYRFNTVWRMLASGQGGWIDSGIFQWGGASIDPVVADALRVIVFSDGTHDLVSIHLRGRGGLSVQTDDRATTPKATLIQYLQ